MCASGAPGGPEARVAALLSIPAAAMRSHVWAPSAAVRRMTRPSCQGLDDAIRDYRNGVLSGSKDEFVDDFVHVFMHQAQFKLACACV